jgi:hypothetical protein
MFDFGVQFGALSLFLRAIAEDQRDVCGAGGAGSKAVDGITGPGNPRSAARKNYHFRPSHRLRH